MTDHICPEPQRFSVEMTTDGPYHIADPTGDWVEWEDAHALCKRVAELEAALIRAWDGWNDRSIFMPEFVTRLAFEARKNKRLRTEKPHDPQP